MNKFRILGVIAVMLALSCINTTTAKAETFDLKAMDYNSNGIIDDGDVEILSKFYNVSKSDSNFQAKYDLNEDGIIDIYDIARISYCEGLIAESNNADITSKFIDPNFRDSIYTLIGKKYPQPILYIDVREIKNLNVKNKNIYNLEGIEYFAELESLDCSYNKLKTLDLHNKRIINDFNCTYNEIKTIYVDDNKPATFNYQTQYKDSTRTNLEKIEITNSSADITNKFIDKNFKDLVYKLTGKAIDEPILVSDVENIKEVSIVGKDIHDLSGLEYFKNLTTLNCNNSELSVLNVGANRELKNLYCNESGLNNLNINSNIKLEKLECSYNNLKSLDVAQNRELNTLICENNLLKTLDLRNNNKLKEFCCCYNEITTLYDIGQRWDEYTYIIQYADASHSDISMDLVIISK